MSSNNTFFAKAIELLRPNTQWYSIESKVTFLDGTVPPTESEIQAKIEELQAEYDAKQYQRDRAVAYPSTEDQLDMLYHQGIDGWKAEIKKVKDQFPKPE